MNIVILKILKLFILL